MAEPTAPASWVPPELHLWLRKLMRYDLAVLTVVWLLVLIPIFLTSAPDPEYAVTVTSADFTTLPNGTLFYEHDDQTRVLIEDLGAGEYTVQIQTSELDYAGLPYRLEIADCGRQYTAVPNTRNRTWETDCAALGGNFELTYHYGKHQDYQIFRDRGETILAGKRLYQDVRTETPPLVNLFWLVPVLLGGDPRIFQLYFAAAVLLAAIILHRAFGRNGITFGAALLLLIMPSNLGNAVAGLQDETLHLAIFLLVLVALLRPWPAWLHGLILAAGIGIKVWPVLLLPGYLATHRDSRSLWQFSAGMLVGGLLIFLPLLILAPDAFLVFVRLYLFGDIGLPRSAISLWRILTELGYGVPLLVNVILGLLLFIPLWRGGRWKRYDQRMIALIVFSIALMVHPKTHIGYYLFPFMLGVMWWDRDAWLVPLLLLTIGMPHVTHLSNNLRLGIHGLGGWLFALSALLTIGLYLVLYWRVLRVFDAELAVVEPALPGAAPGADPPA